MPVATHTHTHTQTSPLSELDYVLMCRHLRCVFVPRQHVCMDLYACVLPHYESMLLDQMYRINSIKIFLHMCHPSKWKCGTFQ